jgi:hypothetical protein
MNFSFKLYILNGLKIYKHDKNSKHLDLECFKKMP